MSVPGSFRVDFLKSTKIGIHDLGKITVINIDKIVYCEADSNYTRIHLYSSILLVTKSLKHIESQLPKSCFIRIHKSYLINKDYIKIIYRRINKLFIILEPDHELPISRRRKASVLKEISKNLLII